MLEERDRYWNDGDQWALKEAMSSKSLQEGGTFAKTLALKLDEVVIAIFASIIDVTDQYCNLSLIQSACKGSPTEKLWLAMFQNQEIMQFHYTNVTVSGTIAKAKALNPTFKCQFPFFWLVKEAFDTQWNIAKQTTGKIIDTRYWSFVSTCFHCCYCGLSGNDAMQLHQRICELACTQPIAEVLNAVDEADCQSLCKCYLHDYVRIVHTVNHRQADKEYQVNCHGFGSSTPLYTCVRVLPYS